MTGTAGTSAAFVAGGPITPAAENTATALMPLGAAAYEDLRALVETHHNCNQSSEP